MQLDGGLDRWREPGGLFLESALRSEPTEYSSALATKMSKCSECSLRTERCCLRFVGDTVVYHSVTDADDANWQYVQNNQACQIIRHFHPWFGVLIEPRALMHRAAILHPNIDTKNDQLNKTSKPKTSAET